MSDRKAVIKNADMSEEMQQDAVDCATQVQMFIINTLVFFASFTLIVLFLIELVYLFAGNYYLFADILQNEILNPFILNIPQVSYTLLHVTSGPNP